MSTHRESGAKAGMTFWGAVVALVGIEFGITSLIIWGALSFIYGVLDHHYG